MIAKKKNVEEGIEKCRSFRMCSNLNDYQFKTSTYRYRTTYMKPTVTTNQKSTMDTQEIERKKHKYTTK